MDKESSDTSTGFDGYNLGDSVSTSFSEPVNESKSSHIVLPETKYLINIIERLSTISLLPSVLVNIIGVILGIHSFVV